MTALSITGGIIIDPIGGNAEPGDIACTGLNITPDAGKEAQQIDANGLHVAPGIIDLGAFDVDIPACIAGGITRVALMPDQSPVIDEPAMVQHAAAAGKPDLWVHPIGAATLRLGGEELGEFGLMKRAGAVAISTGRRQITNSSTMQRVLSYAAALDLIVIAHAEDTGLSGDAVATHGETATRLGLPSASAISEAIAISRDLLLAEEAGAHIHFRTVTTARGFDLIRAAKARGVRVTCGITPGHLLLCDVDIGAYRTFAKLSPPLRSAEDRDACLTALADGTIDVICSGHDPQGPEAKRLPYADAESGMSGAETLLALSLNLVRDGHIDMPRLFALLSANPAQLLGLEGGNLTEGAPADLVVFDADAPWRVDTDSMAASAGNTPFDALPVQGKVIHTIKGGRPLDRPPS
ncbi:amidohydrolase family protein [Parasphingopyxis sp. CP4]|uniref:dihydroorotase n=1 Tax=Parasphingopyxis sp. CP4 TaxID=2724527 RepID=UPI0015A2575D|nr:dihydroorotase [Parasphingopyxis sp. CP4]QLC21259.1 amidohydrolase family protein [Parasphingopyxis sp. CP4]